MSESVAVRHVSIAAEEHTYYFLRLDWKGPDLASGFQVLLTDGESAWDAEVSEEAVRREAAELEMKVQKYVKDLHEVLTGDGPGHSFTLTPYRAGAARTLTYERRQRDIWIRMGSVTLSEHSCPLEEVRDLLSYFLSQTGVLEERNRRLGEENHTLRQEHRHITAELERYAGAKEALEADLFSRFVAVLNEKKAKIRSLQQRISDLQENSHAGVKTGGSEGRGETAAAAAREKPASPGEEEEDEYGGSTDDEEKRAAGEKKKGEEEEEEDEEEAGPAPSAAGPIQSADTRGRASSSDGSLSDSTDVAPCRKRRFRHLRPAPELAAKRPTPPEAPRTHRRDSLVKSNTTANQPSAAQRSSDAMTTGPDVEDLFEDL